MTALLSALSLQNYGTPVLTILFFRSQRKRIHPSLLRSARRGNNGIYRLWLPGRGTRVPGAAGGFILTATSFLQSAYRISFPSSSTQLSPQSLTCPPASECTRDRENRGCGYRGEWGKNIESVGLQSGHLNCQHLFHPIRAPRNAYLALSVSDCAISLRM